MKIRRIVLLTLLMIAPTTLAVQGTPRVERVRVVTESRIQFYKAWSFIQKAYGEAQCSETSEGIFIEAEPAVLDALCQIGLGPGSQAYQQQVGQRLREFWQASSIELLSLEFEAASPNEVCRQVCGRQVLSCLLLSEAERELTRGDLTEALGAAPPGLGFTPRDALIARSQGKRLVILIDFEHRQAQLIQGRQLLRLPPISEGPRTTFEKFRAQRGQPL